MPSSMELDLKGFQREHKAVIKLPDFAVRTVSASIHNKHMIVFKTTESTIHYIVFMHFSVSEHKANWKTYKMCRCNEPEYVYI